MLAKSKYKYSKLCMANSGSTVLVFVLLKHTDIMTTTKEPKAQAASLPTAALAYKFVTFENLMATDSILPGVVASQFSSWRPNRMSDVLNSVLILMVHWQWISAGTTSGKAQK